MSGGGNDGTYVPPVRKKKIVSCEKLVVQTVLMQPNEEVVAMLKAEQVLTVHDKDGSVYVMFGDQVVGYVETPENNQIIECLKAGTFYVADIKEISGTICKVEIHALQL
jgi:hypothetical protein